MPKNAESNAEREGLHVDCLVTEHSQWTKLPRHSAELSKARGQVNPHTSSPCHIEVILTEKEQIVPKPDEEAAEEKDLPAETEETKSYGLGVNSATNKC